MALKTSIDEPVKCTGVAGAGDMKVVQRCKDSLIYVSLEFQHSTRSLIRDMF